jgi:hypothetical protein
VTNLVGSYGARQRNRWPSCDVKHQHKVELEVVVTFGLFETEDFVLRHALDRCHLVSARRQHIGQD